MDVAFEMVDSDEGKVVGEGEGLGVGDADQKGSGEAWAAGDGDGVKMGEGDVGLGKGRAHDRDDGAEMLAGGEFRDDAAVTGVGGDLGGDYGAEGVGATFDDSGCGLVAGGFDGENETGVGHVFSLATCGGADSRGKLALAYCFPPIPRKDAEWMGHPATRRVSENRGSHGV